VELDEDDRLVGEGVSVLMFDGIPGLINDVCVADVAPEMVEPVILSIEGEARLVEFGFEVEVALDAV